MGRSATPVDSHTHASPVTFRSGRKQTADRTRRATTDAGMEPTLSQTLWGRDFLEHLPLTLSEQKGLVVERGDWQRVGDFLSWFPEVQEEQQRASMRPEVIAAKRRYMQTFSDLIECRKDGQTVGIFVGNPEDWSTYYCRVLAFHPGYALRPLLRRFARECLERPLAELGVERLVGETGPTHTAMSRWFLDLGFHVTGQRLTDRWGPLTRFTKFLDTSCSKRFAHRYGTGRGDRRHRGHNKKGGTP